MFWIRPIFVQKYPEKILLIKAGENFPEKTLFTEAGENFEAIGGRGARYTRMHVPRWESLGV